MKIEFDDTQYQFSHGRRPSGRGVWAFKIKSLDKLAPFFIGPQITITAAKALMREQIKRMSLSAAVVVVEVLP